MVFHWLVSWLSYTIQSGPIDLPTPKLVVTEYISMSCTCPNCDRRIKGEFPELIKSRVQYGNGVKVLSIMLNTSYKIHFKKIGRLF